MYPCKYAQEMKEPRSEQRVNVPGTPVFCFDRKCKYYCYKHI